MLFKTISSLVMHMPKLKEVLRKNEVALGTWITINHPDVVEAISTLPLNWLVFDMEHGPLDVSSLEVLLMAIRNPDIAPIVRVPWNDMVVIKRVLDVGATGVLVPWVNTKSEAINVVTYSRYPPNGVRGVGPRRAVLYGAVDFLEYYNRFEAEELVIAIQIETREALKNIEEIASVKEIDVFYVGPMDLSVNLGIPLQYSHPKFEEALQIVLKTCEKYDKVPGIHTFSIDSAKKYMQMGFRFMALMTDISILRSSLLEMLKTMGRS
jgi:2-keto-3-deoxy-L-rhamnonate aldolase RhmA|uniref:2,4-dihydroxyhept-2-ene-1,7-dioic acid aldolase n=1 Tax=Ignisphaera aggregans TaxID=334771 RepID=A0A7J2U3U5_9CREN